MKKDKAKNSEKIKKSDKEIIEELTSDVQRLQADFENHKKRIEKEKSEFVKFANHQIIGNLLPIVDSFQLALKNHQSKEEFVKGVELIYAQLYSLLEQYGVRRIDALNNKFDPYKHEVMLKEESDKEDIVLEELQTGYMLCDKVLRCSKVKIGEKKNESKKKHSKGRDPKACK